MWQIVLLLLAAVAHSNRLIDYEVELAEVHAAQQEVVQEILKAVKMRGKIDKQFLTEKEYRFLLELLTEQQAVAMENMKITKVVHDENKDMFKKGKEINEGMDEKFDEYFGEEKAEPEKAEPATPAEQFLAAMGENELSELKQFLAEMNEDEIAEFKEFLAGKIEEEVGCGPKEATKRAYRFLGHVKKDFKSARKRFKTLDRTTKGKVNGWVKEAKQFLGEAKGKGEKWFGENVKKLGKGPREMVQIGLARLKKMKKN